MAGGGAGGALIIQRLTQRPPRRMARNGREMARICDTDSIFFKKLDPHREHRGEFSAPAADARAERVALSEDRGSGTHAVGDRLRRARVGLSRVRWRLAFRMLEFQTAVGFHIIFSEKRK